MDSPRYIKKGEGSPLLLLCPAGQPPEGMSIYINNLAKYFEVICPNLYDVVEEVNQYNLDVISYKLNIFLSRLNIDNAIIVGMSVGGTFAIAFAAKYPEKVKEVYACDPSVQKLNRSKLQWIIEVIRMELAFFSYPKRILKNEPGFKFMIKEAYKNPFKVLKLYFIAINTYAQKYLANLQTKTFLLWGENDNLIPIPDNSIKLKHNISIHTISKYGHNWYMFEPDKLIQIVKFHSLINLPKED